jgi:hypothetical protein
MKVIFKKTFNRLIQFSIFFISYGFIYKQLFHNRDFSLFWNHLADDYLRFVSSGYFILVCGMMIINWGVESAKWRYLMKKVEPVGFLKAFEAVLTGVTISSFTPNRIGEYFGRIFIMKKGSRLDGALVTVLGSMSQLFITIATGSFAFLLFVPEYLSMNFGPYDYLYYVLVAVVIGFNAILLMLLLNISVVSGIKDRILVNGLKRFRRNVDVFGHFSSRQVAWVLLLSFLRYVVFSTQFYLLLTLFGVSISWSHAIWLISLIYFIMAVIPTVALTELGIRGSISIYIFGLYFSHVLPEVRDSLNTGVFAASTLLWFINLGIPALVGGLFVFRLRFFRMFSRNPSV